MGLPAFAAAMAFSQAAASAFALLVPASTVSDHKYEMRLDNKTIRASSRWLHHRFMLSHYTKLTTTRGSREQDLKLPCDNRKV
jgi:hypothetical protein